MTAARTNIQSLPALLFEGHYGRRALGVFDYAIAIFLFAVAALQATEYWYFSTYIAYLTVPAFLLTAMFRPVGTVVRILPFWIMLAFLAWIGAMGFLSPYRQLAMAHLWFVTKVWSVAILLMIATTNHRQLGLYLKAVLIGAFIAAAAGAIAGYSTTRFGGERVSGIARQANAFGAALLHGILAGGILLPFASRPWKFAVRAFFVAAFIALLASGSRGAAAGAFAAVTAYAVFEHLPRLSKRPWMIVPAILIVVVPLLVAVTVFPNAPLVERFVELGQRRTGATSSRWDLYLDAWELFLKHPFFGTGMGTFRAYSWAVYTHTTFLDLLTGAGIPAFLLYYSLYLLPLLMLGKLARAYASVDKWRKTLNAWRAALIGMLMHGAFAAVYFDKISTCLLAAVTAFAARHLWELHRLSREPRRAPGHDAAKAP